MVLLCGRSGSGKSTLVHGGEAAAIALDGFYREGNDPLLPRRGRRPDWEAIGALDLDLLDEALSGVLADRRAHVPVYNFRSAVARGHIELCVADPLIVIEGLHAAALRERLVCLGCRVRRDSRAGSARARVDGPSSSRPG